MGAQQGKERGSHSSGSHGGTASCIGVSSNSPVGSHGLPVNALGVGSTLRGSRIKSSVPPAAVSGGLHHRSVGAGGVSAASSGHSTKDSRCNPIGMNIFTEHNGRSNGDPTVNMIRAFAYDSTGYIYYKIDICEEYEVLPQRTKTAMQCIKPCQLYSKKLDLSKKKWDHLQDLKKLLPKDCHSFYDNLPYKA